MSKTKLPNLIGGLNYTDEYNKYIALYSSISRTQSGNTSYTSTSSGTTYNTATSTDENIYNKGEEGLMNLLFSILKDYLIDSTFVQYIESILDQVEEKLAGVPAYYDVRMTYANGTYTVVDGYLPSTLPSEIFYIRFTATQASASADKIKLSATSTEYNIKMLDGSDIPANVWANGARVTLSVGNDLVQLQDGDKPAGSSYVVQSAEPADVSLLWVDSGNSYIAKVYSGGTWVPIAGVFKSV